jgi:hypothetical protein
VNRVFASSLLLLALCVESCGREPEVREAQKAHETALKVVSNCVAADFIRETRPCSRLLLVTLGGRYREMTQGDMTALGVALALVAKETAATFNIALCDSSTGRVLSAYRTDTLRVLSPETRAILAARRDEDEKVLGAAEEKQCFGRVNMGSDPVIAEVTPAFWAQDYDDQEAAVDVLRRLAQLQGASGDVILVKASSGEYTAIWDGLWISRCEGPVRLRDN